MHGRCVALIFLAASGVVAQERQDLSDIVRRLERLEDQNRELLTEIRSLRQQLADRAATPGAPPGQAAVVATPATVTAPAEERLEVQESRVAELDQAKIGAEQRLPVSMSGTVLFNAFLNGRSSNGQFNPVVAATAPAPGQAPLAAAGGATLRQTILGFHFQGPELRGGAKVSGSLFLDLFGGTGTALNQLLRLRIATIDVGWKNTTLSAGQDKPIMAPREPDSLAQVGVSPLTAAGNLWLWQPQVRVEHRFNFGDTAGLRAQVGVLQTSESTAGVPADQSSTLAQARPGFEGRFEFWGERNGRRFEIAPSFHISNSQLLGQSVPSRIYSVDWLLRPFAKVDFTGQFIQGENMGVIGGLRQGIRIANGTVARSVHGQGGWAQVTLRATPRWTFHLYGGQEDDRNSDLGGAGLGKNLTYAGNVMYRIGPNVLASFEASQVRSSYLGAIGTRLNPHYDLGLAYLF